MASKLHIGHGRDNCAITAGNQNLCRQDFEFKFNAVLYDLMDYGRRDRAIADIAPPSFPLVGLEILETTAQQFQDDLGVFSMLFRDVKIVFDCLSSGCDMEIFKDNAAIWGKHFYTDYYDAEVTVELSKISKEVILRKTCPPIVKITDIRSNGVALQISGLYCSEIILNIVSELTGIRTASTMRCFTPMLTTVIENLSPDSRYTLRVDAIDNRAVVRGDDVEFTTKGPLTPPSILVTSVTLDKASVYISEVPAQGQMIFYLKGHGDVAVHVHDGSKTNFFETWPPIPTTRSTARFGITEEQIRKPHDFDVRISSPVFFRFIPMFSGSFPKQHSCATSVIPQGGNVQCCT